MLKMIVSPLDTKMVTALEVAGIPQVHYLEMGAERSLAKVKRYVHKLHRQLLPDDCSEKFEVLLHLLGPVSANEEATAAWDEGVSGWTVGDMHDSLDGEPFRVGFRLVVVDAVPWQTQGSEEKLKDTTMGGAVGPGRC